MGVFLPRRLQKTGTKQKAQHKVEIVM